MKILEIGGGSNPQYHPNLDSRQLPTVDIVHDIETLPFPIANGEYDMIFSSYALEHVSWKNIDNVLKELYRITNNNGELLLVLPNTYKQCKLAIEKETFNEYMSCTLFGGQEEGFSSHKCGFSPDNIIKRLVPLGYNEIIIVEHPNCKTDMIVKAKKKLSVTPNEITRQQWIRDQVSINDKVLDIGSNNGIIWKEETLRNQITCMDMDKYNLPNFIQLDAHKLLTYTAIADKQFDIVIMGDMIEHVRDPELVIKGSLRVGKKVVITAPDPNNWNEKFIPFGTMEKEIKEKGKTSIELAKESNGALEFDTSDNCEHIFHHRWFTYGSWDKLLDKVCVNDYEYKTDMLYYGGWSFFMTVIKSNKEVITYNYKDYLNDKIKEGKQ